MLPMILNIRSILVIVCVGLASMGDFGCGNASPVMGTEENAEVSLAISAAPSDVGCLRATTTGNTHSVIRTVAVTPGNSVSARMSGLPTGMVSILFEAFDSNCMNVTAAAIPTWTSDPITTTLTGGRPITIAVSLRRNGVIDVTVDWESDPVPPNLMFVSSTSYTGDLGGLAGADAKCQERATAGGLKGTFRAFLQSTQASVQIRLSGASGWLRPDGRPLVNSVDDLLSGRILYPPVLDEYGSPRVSIVASGISQAQILRDGSIATGSACVDWTSNDDSQTYEGPWSSMSGLSALTGAAAGCGSFPFALYCFETARRSVVSAQAPAGARVAFVTSQPFKSGGGIASADQLCGDEAAAAGLQGHYAALLATRSAAAISRFDVNGSPWVRTDGVLVAETASAFAAGSILAHISVTAKGQYVDRNGSFVWIGSHTLDTPGTNTCEDWTSTDPNTSVGAFWMQGSAPAWPAVGGWDNSSSGCGAAALFCLQQ